MEARYIARKTFKYGGRVVYPGDLWKPNGGKFDQKIIRNNFVRLDLTEQDEEVLAVESPESEVVDEIKERVMDVNQHNHRGGGKRGQRDRRAGVPAAKDPHSGNRLDSVEPGV